MKQSGFCSANLYLSWKCFMNIWRKSIHQLPTHLRHCLKNSPGYTWFGNNLLNFEQRLLSLSNILTSQKVSLKLDQQKMFGDSANNGFQLIDVLLSWSSITLLATIVFITPISQCIVSWPFKTKWCMNISLWHFVLYNPFIWMSGLMKILRRNNIISTNFRTNYLLVR